MFSTQLTLNTNLSIRCNKTSSIVFDHTWINSLIIKSGFSDLLNSILYKSVIIKICLNCIKIYIFKLDIFKIDTTFQSSSSIKMCQKYLSFIQNNEVIKAPNDIIFKNDLILFAVFAPNVLVIETVIFMRIPLFWYCQVWVQVVMIPIYFVLSQWVVEAWIV